MLKRGAGAAIALSLAIGLVACGPAVTTQQGSVDSELSRSTSVVLSPVSDAALSIALELVQTTAPAIGADNVKITLTRGGHHVTVPCNEITNTENGVEVACQLSRGDDDGETQEAFGMQIVRSASNGASTYTLVQAMHEQEGTEWIPLIEMLYPAWKTKAFAPEELAVVAKGSAAKDPFALGEAAEALLAEAAQGLTLPYDADRIELGTGARTSIGKGPFAATDPSVALFGDYGAGYVFTIAAGVWYELPAPTASVFATDGDPQSGLATAATLRARLEQALATQ